MRFSNENNFDRRGDAFEFKNKRTHGRGDSGYTGSGSGFDC